MVLNLKSESVSLLYHKFIPEAESSKKKKKKYTTDLLKSVQNVYIPLNAIKKGTVPSILLSTIALN